MKKFNLVFCRKDFFDHTNNRFYYKGNIYNTLPFNIPFDKSVFVFTEYKNEYGLWIDRLNFLEFFEPIDKIKLRKLKIEKIWKN